MKKALEKIKSRLELVYKIKPELKDEFVKEIEFEGVKIPIKFDSFALFDLTGQYSGGVASQKRGIVVNENILDDERYGKFVIAHEMGHVYHEHTVCAEICTLFKVIACRLKPSLAQKWHRRFINNPSYKNERAADEFAIKLLGITKEEYSKFRGESTHPTYVKVREDILATMA